MFLRVKTYQTTIKNGLKNVTDTPNVRGFSICFFSAVPYLAKCVTNYLLQNITHK